MPSCRAESKNEEPVGNIVVDLLEYSVGIINDELRGFFEKNCTLWRYNENELKEIMNGTGERLEQYAVFQEYLEKIHGLLDEFADSRGFHSQKDVLIAVEEAIDLDKKQRAQLMNEMASMFAKLRTNAGIQKAEGKDEDVLPKKKVATIFSQPIGLDFLLSSVLNLSEYETFRMMMIMKVKEMQMIDHVDQSHQKRIQEAKDRKKVLSSDPSQKELEYEFQTLKSRIVHTSPHLAKQIHLEIDEYTHLSGKMNFDWFLQHIIQLATIGSPGLAAELESRNFFKYDHADWLLLLHESLDTITDDTEARLLQQQRCPVTGRGSSAVSTAASAGAK